MLLFVDVVDTNYKMFSLNEMAWEIRTWLLRHVVSFHWGS